MQNKHISIIKEGDIVRVRFKNKSVPTWTEIVTYKGMAGKFAHFHEGGFENTFYLILPNHIMEIKKI